MGARRSGAIFSSQNKTIVSIHTKPWRVGRRGGVFPWCYSQYENFCIDRPTKLGCCRGASESSWCNFQ